MKEAEGGTLFLDEIGVIRPYIQAKLLRLLQDKEYKPLGDPRPRKADVRIVSATNKSLKNLMKEDLFREDLYYRLNIVTIHIPPLRERKEDIPILVVHFIEKYSRQFNKPVMEVSNSAMNAFLSYSWPGNIREIENIIQEIIVMSASSVISAEDVLPLSDEPCFEKSEIVDLKTAKKKQLETFERAYLLRLLREHRGNVVRAAIKAGKSRTGFWNLIRKYNLSPKKFRV